jgi:putative hydrolase of the HAD superfamily
MIDIIGFDADDTLWENEFHYRAAKKIFIKLLAPYQPGSLSGDTLDKIEIGNIRTYGYGIKSFGLSMIEAALDLSAGKIEADLLDELITLVKEMLRAPVPLTPGVEETLAGLASDYPLILITKGDLFEQERKIQRSGLARYFKFIEVVGEKTEASYGRVLGKYEIDPTRFLMIGNSLKSDILPVLKLGGQAVYIPHAQTWHHETVDESELKAWDYGQIKQLRELPEYISTRYPRS